MKISLKDIFEEHLGTFKKSGGGFLKMDLIVFIGIPSLVTVSYFMGIGVLPVQFIEALLTVFSILTPLLFGLLPMVFVLIDNDNVSCSGFDLVNLFKANVLFTILLCLLLVCLLLLWFICSAKFVLGVGIVWLVVEVVLHLFMIMKRFNVLINEYIVLKRSIKDT